MKLVLVSLVSTLALLGCRTTDSAVKADKGDTLKKGSYNVKLTNSGDLYCNPYSRSSGGNKIAYNIKWFELDKDGDVFALSDDGDVYYINLSNTSSCTFKRNKVAYNVKKLVTAKGYFKQVNAIGLLHNNKLKMFDRAGTEVRNNMHSIRDITFGCSHTSRKGSQYVGFAINQSGTVFAVEGNGRYQKMNGDWDSLRKFMDVRKVCKSGTNRYDKLY